MLNRDALDAPKAPPVSSQNTEVDNNVEMKSVSGVSMHDEQGKPLHTPPPLQTKLSSKKLSKKGSAVRSQKDIEFFEQEFAQAMDPNHEQHKAIEIERQSIVTTGVPVLKKEDAEHEDDLFHSTSIMIPFYRARFWLTFRLHMMPYYYQIFHPEMKELEVMTMNLVKGASVYNTWVVFMSMPQYMMPVMFLALIYIYTNEACLAETYSDQYVPVFQAISGVFIAPALVIIAHRISISNKYATLSVPEYDKLMSETSIANRTANTQYLNLATGWSQLRDFTVLHEVNIAAARSGLDNSKQFHFYIANPLQDYAAFSNFRMWQAFLLGRHHLSGITHELHPDLESIMKKVVSNSNSALQMALDRLVAGDLNKHTHANYDFLSRMNSNHNLNGSGRLSESSGKYSGNVLEVNNETLLDFKIAREADATKTKKDVIEAVGPALSAVKNTKAKFALLVRKEAAVNKKINQVAAEPAMHYEISVVAVARALAKRSSAIPTTGGSIVHNAVNICGYLIAFMYFYPLLPFVGRRLNPSLPTFVHICAYYCLVYGALITSLFWRLTCNFLALNYADSWRRHYEALSLGQMLRPNDLDLHKIVPQIGVSQAQRAEVPDYIDRFFDSTAKPSLKFKSSRNPEVARLPRIYIHHGGRNNFNAWGNLRTICRNFGQRFKYRMNLFAVLNFSVVFGIFSFIFLYGQVQLGPAKRGVCFPPASRLPAVHPLVLQAIIAATSLNIGIIAIVFSAAKANTAFKNHTGDLLQRLLLNEAQRCFMADMVPKQVQLDKTLMEPITERLLYLSEVSKSIGIVMKSLQYVDANLSVRFFGVAATLSMISLLLTYNGLWFSAFSALFASLKQFPLQFMDLFLNADYETLCTLES